MKHKYRLIQLLDFFKHYLCPLVGLDWILIASFNWSTVYFQTQLELQYKGSLKVDSFMSCGYLLLSVLFKNTKLLLWCLVWNEKSAVQTQPHFSSSGSPHLTILHNVPILFTWNWPFSLGFLLLYPACLSSVRSCLFCLYIIIKY